MFNRKPHTIPMKQPSWLRRLSPITVIYAIAIPLCLLFIYRIGYLICPDTKTYFDALISLQNGGIDQWRTPVYPLFLGCIEFVLGDQIQFVVTSVFDIPQGVPIYFEQITGSDSSLVAYSVVGIQFIVFLVSLFYFYKIARLLTRSERGSVVFTLLYLFAILISEANNCLITESFSLSAIIFFLYSFVQSIKKDSNSYAIAVLFWSLFLVFLRPSFLYIPCCALFIGLCLLFAKKYRRAAFKNIVVSCITILAMSVYCCQFKNVYGVFSPTSVSVINQYWIASQDGIIDPNEITDNALRTDVQDLPKPRGEGKKWLIKRHGAEKINSMVANANELNREQYLKNIWKRFKTASGNSMIHCTNDTVIFYLIQQAIGVELRLEIFMMLLYVVLIFYWRKSRPNEELFYLILIVLLSASNWIVSVLGAPNDFSRLLMANVPLFFLLAADLVIRFSQHVAWRKRKNQAKVAADQ